MLFGVPGVDGFEVRERNPERCRVGEVAPALPETTDAYDDLRMVDESFSPGSGRSRCCTSSHESLDKTGEAGRMAVMRA